MRRERAGQRQAERGAVHVAQVDPVIDAAVERADEAVRLVVRAGGRALQTADEARRTAEPRRWVSLDAEADAGGRLAAREDRERMRPRRRRIVNREHPEVRCGIEAALR